MTVDSRRRFSKMAGDYHRHRPSYPPELLDWILETANVAHGAPVADVGCGTGIATRLLAERGLEVIGIDPNEEMLAFARQEGGPPYLRGEAAATGLADGSMDLVTVGQAFHWFELPSTLREFRRILTEGGWCAAFWNVRHLTPGFMEEYDELLRTMSSEYEILEKPAKATETLKVAKGVKDVREGEFGNVQRLDQQGLHGRAYSSSYVVHGIADKGAFDAALARLFHRHQKDGAVELTYRTIGICFRIGETEPC